MDKAMFEKYIQEMMKMKAQAMPVTEKEQPKAVKVNAEPLHQTKNDENMSGIGGLIVNATAIRGLYPVENAKVTVFTGTKENMNVIAEAVTDISGKTPLIKLGAPSSVYTEAPDPSERPYAYYNIETSADGYITTDNYNVAVFDKVTSLQNVSLYPLISAPEGNRPIVIDEFDNYEL